MKFAAYAMIFDQEKWIMPYLDNVYPQVDRIYLAYSKYPWSYNPKARETYKNTFDLDIVRKSKYMDKITIIEGEWNSDAQERTACLQQAKKDGIDYLIAQDLDEFFFAADYDKLRNAIINNPDYDVYLIPQYSFWKSFKYVIHNAKTGIRSEPTEKIINVKTVDYYSENNLQTNAKRKAAINNIVYYHGSYVLTNEECYKKIKTWTHTNDFDSDKWYNEVWLPWTPESKNLHPIWPNIWPYVEEFKGKLPESIKDFGKKVFTVATYESFGDMLSSYGIIKEFSKKYDKILYYFNGSNLAYENGKRLYSSIPEVEIIRIKDFKELHIDYAIANTNEWTKKVEPWDKNPELPITPELEPKEKWYNEKHWYDTAGLPFSLKWDNFEIKRNLIDEKYIFYNKLGLKDGEDFVILHEDTKRGFEYHKEGYKINREYLPKNIKIIELQNHKDISLLDLTYTFQRAKEIHTFNSGVAIFVDLVLKEHGGLYYHDYVRRKVFWRPSFKLKWHEIKNRYKNGYLQMRGKEYLKTGLLDLCREFPENTIMAEIGSYAGDGTVLFFESGKVQKLYAIDPWEEGYNDTDEASDSDFTLVEKAFNKNVKNLKVEKLKGTLKSEFSKLPKLDVIYIDGNHDYEYVLSDIKLALKKIKPGGIICGHDYHYYGGDVPKVVNEIFGKPDKIFNDTSWMIKVLNPEDYNKKRYLLKKEYLSFTEKYKDLYHWQSAGPRWIYHECAINMLKDIKDINNKSILEAGTMGTNICKDSDTIDLDLSYAGWPLLYTPTYYHDMAKLPWPIKDKQYDVFVALRVMTYFMNEPKKYFDEIRRISNHAILAFAEPVAEIYRSFKKPDKDVKYPEINTTVLYYNFEDNEEILSDNHNSRVTRKDNLVYKTINHEPDTTLNKELFEREVFWLEKLSSHNITPKIIDYYDNTIIMTYCGVPVTNEELKLPEIQKQIINILKILLENRCFYNDFDNKNLLILNGKVKLIDFNWCPMVKEDYTCGEKVKSKTISKPWGNFYTLFNNII